MGRNRNREGGIARTPIKIGVIMDSLPEDEIEQIWSRVKAYINTKNISSISTKMIADEIENEMIGANVPTEKERNPQAMMDFLTLKGFHKEASKNIKIKKELVGMRIREIEIRGVKRFQIVKGTSTFKFDGKSIKAGQFISGKTRDEAVKKLNVKIEKVE